jgi:hypothetical protein
MGRRNALALRPIVNANSVRGYVRIAAAERAEIAGTELELYYSRNGPFQQGTVPSSRSSRECRRCVLRTFGKYGVLKGLGGERWWNGGAGCHVASGGLPTVGIPMDGSASGVIRAEA